MDATVRRGVRLWNTALLLTGFSGLSLNPEWVRGPDSPINSCMWALVTYAGRCRGADGSPGPEIVSLESVQGAYKKGRSLMQALRVRLEDETNTHYDLNHVLMSGSSVGSPQYRHRYYLVLSRVPFGVDPPRREDLPDERPVTYFDALADLQGLDMTWDEQAYRFSPASQFAAALRRDDCLVSDHVTADGKIAPVVTEACRRGWKSGWMSEALDEIDYHPEEFERSRRPEGIRRGDSTYKGLSWPRRVVPGKPAHVTTGGCARDFVHWSEPRLLTIRELSRLMGYPDSWEWPHSVSQASALTGKCSPVQSNRWLSTWARRALEGSPGARGESIGEREYLTDVTSLYKSWL